MFILSEVIKYFSCFGREKANAGSLTNFELFDFLRSRGATSDPMGCLGSVAPSECKVPHYFFRLCTSQFFELTLLYWYDWEPCST
jgi:hypothetical protein